MSLLESGRGQLLPAEEDGRAIGYVTDGDDGALRFYERLGLEPHLHVLLGRVPDL